MSLTSFTSFPAFKMSRQGVAYSADQHQDILMQLDPEDLQRAYLKRFPPNAGLQTPSSIRAEPNLSTRSSPAIKRTLTAPSVCRIKFYMVIQNRNSF